MLSVARVRQGKADPKTERRSSSDLFSLPERSHPEDVGLDLRACQHVLVGTGLSARISHNLAVALPPDTFGLILPRSSTLANKGLIVVPGVIDPGFRGEVQTVVYNAGLRTAQVVAGERLSQLIVLPVLKVAVEEAETLPAVGARGERGFGSSGGYSEPAK